MDDIKATEAGWLVALTILGSSTAAAYAAFKGETPATVSSWAFGGGLLSGATYLLLLDLVN